jgi:hypothetical protein
MTKVSIVNLSVIVGPILVGRELPPVRRRRSSVRRLQALGEVEAAPADALCRLGSAEKIKIGVVR